MQRLEDDVVVDPTAFSSVRWWGKASGKTGFDQLQVLFVDVLLFSHLLG